MMTFFDVYGELMRFCELISWNKRLDASSHVLKYLSRSTFFY